MAFGSAPDPSRPAQLYPGISAARFNPLEAGRCWAEAIKKEKELRSVHQYLDAHGKLGLPDEWAKGRRPKDDLMPGYDSIEAAYKMLGWKQHKGRVFAPDPHARQKRRVRSMGRRGAHVKIVGNESMLMPTCGQVSASASSCKVEAEILHEQSELAHPAQEFVQRKNKACNRESKIHGGKTAPKEAKTAATAKENVPDAQEKDG